MTIPSDLRYHKEHEWVRVDGRRATIGLSDFAQDALGDIVYMATPKVGASVAYGTEITEVESTKTVSPVYAPVAGTIVAFNEALKEQPEAINRDPYGNGWIVVIEMTDPKELDALMTAAQYESFLQANSH
jgi:glycine cleavage system H protein